MAGRGERTFIVVHDSMDEHAKIEPLSDKAFRGLFKVWFWCSRNRSDGHMPAAVWKKRAPAAVRRELVTAGLVEDHGEKGVWVHDYLGWQRSAAELAEIKEEKRQAGLKGNHQRWHTGPRGRPQSGCPWCPDDALFPPPDGDDVPLPGEPPEDEPHGSREGSRTPSQPRSQPDDPWESQGRANSDVANANKQCSRYFDHETSSATSKAPEPALSRTNAPSTPSQVRSRHRSESDREKSPDTDTDRSLLTLASSSSRNVDANQREKSAAAAVDHALPAGVAATDRARLIGHVTTALDAGTHPAVIDDALRRWVARDGCTTGLFPNLLTDAAKRAAGARPHSTRPSTADTVAAGRDLIAAQLAAEADQPDATIHHLRDRGAS